ncbi:hypothetical protein DSECCO2_449140 [anaerobic digester metagenome]
MAFPVILAREFCIVQRFLLVFRKSAVYIIKRMRLFEAWSACFFCFYQTPILQNQEMYYEDYQKSRPTVATDEPQ